MTRRPQHTKGWFPRLRHVGSVTLAAVGIVVGSTTVAAAYLALTHLGTGAARAGAVGAPASFSATSTFPNVATLSWTPPSDPAPTSYTLTQSPGTLAGTCTTLSAGSVSCTATDLVQGTTYTWHLVADDHSWSSPPVSVTKPTITPSIALAPASGNGGTSVKVTGGGFAASSGLTFSFTPLGGTPGALSPTNCTAPVTTTATGALPAAPCEITIPTTSATGAGTVKVTDAAGNSATATFTVTPVARELGTMTVTPSTAVASSTGNTFEFDFVAGAGGLTQGTVALTIPPGWTLPSTTAGSAGYVTLTPPAAGTLTITGTTTAKVTGVTLAAGKGFAILYGTGGGTTGVTVTSTLGTSTFTTKEASTSTGTLATIAVQPKVNVVGQCTPLSGSYTLAAGATTHFSLRGASGGNGGNRGGGTGAGGTVVSGALTNTSGATVTLTYTLGCKGTPGKTQEGGAGGPGYTDGGAGGTGHSDKAGGGGGGGGASALTFTVGRTTTVVAVAGGGGGGGGKNTDSGKGGGPASATPGTASTPAVFGGGPGASPSKDDTGGAGGGGGGGGVHASASGGATGAGGTGGTSFVHGTGTFTGIIVGNLSVATGTNGATATIGFR